MSVFRYREQPGYFQRLKQALEITQKDLGRRIDKLIGRYESDFSDECLEELESILLSADIGLHMTSEIIDQIGKKNQEERFLTASHLKRTMHQAVLQTLQRAGGAVVPSVFRLSPHVILVIGVNGVGKTTTVGKLAHRFQAEGREVLICASDTFRAAAVDQLVAWGVRTNTEVVQERSGFDPAAVLFDAVAVCKARHKQILIVDTAGRLHTNRNLMQELEKIKRVAAREVVGAPHEVYLVLDATTGQNGLVQAREFLQWIGVTGIIVTKLDGTAKGGIVVAIAKELKIPICYLGVGEAEQDLIPFSPEPFVDSLFSGPNG